VRKSKLPDCKIDRLKNWQIQALLK
jgi:hypothetical protein